MTIYDIAKAANVAPSTVSRVINGNKNVKQSTREKVEAIIKEAGYTPNVLARNLSVGDSNTIAFVVPDIDNQFFTTLLHGITDMAMEIDANVFMFGTDENIEREQKVLSSLTSEMIKGIIIIPVLEENRTTKEKLTKFEESGIPVVLIDRDVIGSGFDGIFSEDSNGSAQAVELLIAEGHSNIAIITGPLTSYPGRERFKGYERALADNNITLNQEYVVNGGFRVQESYNAMKKIMQLEPRPTAIFTSNNLTTLGCLKYMKEHNMHIYEDISLVGFDDIPELTYTDINLTVVTRPVYKMGCDAMNLLKMRFPGSELSEGDRGIVRRHLVKTQIIKRGSEKYRPFEKNQE